MIVFSTDPALLRRIRRSKAVVKNPVHRDWAAERRREASFRLSGMLWYRVKQERRQA